MVESATLTKIKNGVITLPPKLREILRDVEAVYIIPTERTLIIKPVEKPLRKLSDLASRVSSPAMSTREIQKEIRSYRTRS